VDDSTEGPTPTSTGQLPVTDSPSISVISSDVPSTLVPSDQSTQPDDEAPTKPSVDNIESDRPSDEGSVNTSSPSSDPTNSRAFDDAESTVGPTGANAARSNAMTRMIPRQSINRSSFSYVTAITLVAWMLIA
jgi:hypothetical protein